MYIHQQVQGHPRGAVGWLYTDFFLSFFFFFLFVCIRTWPFLPFLLSLLCFSLISVSFLTRCFMCLFSSSSSSSVAFFHFFGHVRLLSSSSVLSFISTATQKCLFVGPRSPRLRAFFGQAGSHDGRNRCLGTRLHCRSRRLSFSSQLQSIPQVLLHFRE